MPASRLDGTPWPRMTVVTVTLNRAAFLEEAIRSVLLQGYPDVEYIVVDGGSTDGSVDVIRRYEPWLAAWVSEPDRGTCHALNKGFARATGTLLAPLSSDDRYEPEAFVRVAEAHVAAPTAIVLGEVQTVDVHDGQESPAWVGRPFGVTFRNAVHPLGAPWFWHAAALFVPAEAHQRAGPFDETLRYTSDHDWLCRLTRHAPVVYVTAPLVRFRVHPDATSVVNRLAQLRELSDVVERYWHCFPELDPAATRALYRVHEAAMYLGQHAYWAEFWNRRAGARTLLAALRADPGVVRSPLFRRLCLRAVLPRRWLRSSPWKAESASPTP